MLEAFLVSPTAGNMSFMVASLSYKGQFNLGLLGDPKTCPDLALLGEGIDGPSFAELHPVATAATAS